MKKKIICFKNMQKRKTRETVLKYYEFIDKNKIGKLLHLFSDDVYYKRCGLILKGKKEFEMFYRRDRSISGKHNLKMIIQQGNKVVVEGNFVGKWRDGTHLKLNFVDIIFFNKLGKICRRYTYTDQGKV